MITYNKNKFFEIKLKVNNISCELKNKLSEIDSIIVKSIKDKKTNNWRKPRPKVKKSFDCKEAGLINSNLNKLSPLNFDKISKNILDLIKNNNSILGSCIENIFKTAVGQPTYCEQYIKLIKLIIDSGYDIMEILDNKCHLFTNLLKFKLSENGDSEFDYDEFCKTIKEKNYKNGFSKFVGELANYSLISSEFIKINIELFIQNLEEKIKENPQNEFIEDNILCLTKLILTCLNKIDSLDTILLKIQEFRKCNIIKRLKFKLMDLEDEIKSFNNI